MYCRTCCHVPLYRRLYTRGFWGNREFLCIDTGGLMSDAEKLPKEQQARCACCGWWNCTTAVQSSPPCLASAHCLYSLRLQNNHAAAVSLCCPQCTVRPPSLLVVDKAMGVSSSCLCLFCCN